MKLTRILVLLATAVHIPAIAQPYFPDPPKPGVQAPTSQQPVGPQNAQLGLPTQPQPAQPFGIAPSAASGLPTPTQASQSRRHANRPSVTIRQFRSSVPEVTAAAATMCS